MSVIINLGDGVTFTISVNNQSGFLYGAYQDYGNGYVVDLHTLLKNVSKASLANYVYFLTHEKRPVVVDQDILNGCLEIYHITEDKNYFCHLMGQLHKFWTLLSPILYGDEVHPHVKQDIYLYCPYQVLPKSYLNNKVFFNEWLKLNLNKEIVLNDDQKFKYQQHIEDDNQYNQQHTATYVTPHDVKVTKLFTNIFIKTYYNDSIEGEEIYLNPDDGSVTSSLSTINHRMNGYCIDYNPNGEMISKVYRVDDAIIGVFTSYYPDGVVRSQLEFNNDKIVKASREWYDDANHTLKTEKEYINGCVMGATMYYLDGDSAKIDFVYSDDDGSHLHSITMFNRDGGYMIWRIICGLTSQSRSKQTFFDREGKVVKEEIFESGWTYDYEDRQWCLWN